MQDPLFIAGDGEQRRNLAWATGRNGRTGTSPRQAASMQPERKVSSCHISFLITKPLDQKCFPCV